MSTQAYKVNIRKVIYLYKYLLYNYLHLRPAGYPLICSCGTCLACGGPYNGGVCAVRIVAVRVAPGVDEVVSGYVGVGKDHSGFGFEVPFAGGGY